MNELRIVDISTITFAGWGRHIIVGLRNFAGAGLIAWIGLNIALWWSVRVR